MSGREETTNAVLVEVAVERARQEAKWGEQNHEPARYLAILAEEFGEAAQATVEVTFGADELRCRLREELIQTAAVAVAFVECLDRGALPVPAGEETP